MATPKFKFTVIKAPGARVDTAGFVQDLTRMMRRAVTEGQRHIAKYPPQRLRKSGYRRTGTLKRSWSKRVTASGSKLEGIVGSNSNIAPYNVVVQGTRKGTGRRQGRIFRRAGWRGVDELSSMMEDRVEKGLQAIVDRLAR
ncbi:hypothetical protein LCGC14_1990400 [marine sediment metagenome]|uniref:HK97 gp10 family phage protein n=1 Tax=marine sediment metagenome TaxID=412755 RepID=A0A0F9F6I1_9ZZZZ